ncbi:hypothetical protein D3C74_495120 [compost metagenome]
MMGVYVQTGEGQNVKQCRRRDRGGRQRNKDGDCGEQAVLAAAGETYYRAYPGGISAASADL